MNTLERRMKIFWLNPADLMGWFNMPKSVDVVYLPAIGGLPDDCTVVNVFTDYLAPCRIGIVLQHHSFDVVLDGEKVPSIGGEAYWTVERIARRKPPGNSVLEVLKSDGSTWMSVLNPERERFIGELIDKWIVEDAPVPWDAPTHPTPLADIQALDDLTRQHGKPIVDEPDNPFYTREPEE